VDQVDRKPEGIKNIRYIFFLSLALVLPGIQWPVLMWMSGLAPLLAFFLLYGCGWSQGNRIILLGVVLSCAVCLFLQTLPLILLSLTALPAGYVIAYAAGRSEDQISTGVKGVMTLGVCWLLFWGGLAGIHKGFSYSALIHWLQEGVDVSLNVYRQNKNIPVDSLVVIDQMLNQMKIVLPKILPAILTSIVFCIIWLTMVAGNFLLLKNFGKAPWPEYKLWKLPEKLIWAEIFAAVLALIPMDPFRSVGVNLLILVSLVFVFQGLSILIFFFNKWNMPVFFRWFIYILAVIQSSGTIVLLAVGIADIWLDLRRLNKEAVVQDH
jgi:hypothetical protein